MSKKEKDIKRLIKHIANEDVVPFLGSGFSLKAGAPSVWKLKEAIANDGGIEFAEENGDLRKISLAELSEKHVEYNGGSRNALLALLKKLFELQPTDLTDHKYLRLIPHFKSLYTTNYETFIEAAYPTDELHIVNSNAAFTFDGSKPITLYKIHGDLSTLSSPDSVVITTRDYNDYFKGKKFELLWTQLKNDAGKRSLLFIGYSLEDPNILTIIKKVRQLSGGSSKEWFLVAPDLNESKVTQLKRLGVTYINAKAEEILPQILESLKDRVDSDYRHKLLSTETYSRFCEINGRFRPMTVIGTEKNEVTQYNPVEGTAFKHQMQMKLPAKLDLNNPAAYTSYMPFGDTSIKIPAICIPSNEMASFVHTLNGISMAHKDDISNVFIGPATDTLKWTLRQRSIPFKEKVKGCRYTLGDAVHIKLQTPLYVLHMFGTADDGWRIEFNFNEKVSSVREALRWLQFLIVATENKTFELENIIIKSDDNMDDLLKELHRIKSYFEALNELEHKYDIDFETIDGFNEQNLTKALMVYSYYSKKAIRHTINEDGRFVFHVDETKLNGTIPILKESQLMMTRCDKLGKVALCGKEFSFNFLLTFYNDVEVTKCEKSAENENFYLTSFVAAKGTQDILAVDTLPDFYREGKTSGEEEGLALYYKPGEREKYGVL